MHSNFISIWAEAGESKLKKTKAKRPKNSDSDASDEFVPKKKKAPAKVRQAGVYLKHQIFFFFFFFTFWQFFFFSHHYLRMGGRERRKKKMKWNQYKLSAPTAFKWRRLRLLHSHCLCHPHVHRCLPPSAASTTTTPRPRSSFVQTFFMSYLRHALCIHLGII